MSKVELMQGDCLDLLPGLPDNSVHSCVTDPPYELGFMGRAWDKSGIAYNVEMWREVLRVLKPGAHLVAFGGTRTYHRMACAIEDAGFEIRDSIHWLYGQGFPKSLDVSKAIDKMAGVEREITGYRSPFPADHARPNKNFSRWSKALDKAREQSQIYGHLDNNITESGLPITAPATDLARQWSGFGTALKPAHEPIVLARKPLSEPTVAENVIKWGCGGLNIDACRVGINHWTKKDGAKSGSDNGHIGQLKNRQAGVVRESNMGRWPSNIILSHSPSCNGACVEGCAVRELDGQSGERPSGGGLNGKFGGVFSSSYDENGEHKQVTDRESKLYFDQGGASRFYHTAEWDIEQDFIIPFYYCAKASRRERGEGNSHPCVKPISLMRYLARLITPPGGHILEPFLGSGTTAIAAEREYFSVLGMDKEADCIEIARKRLGQAEKQSSASRPVQPTLFAKA